MIYPLDWPTGINNVLCLDTSYIYVNAMDVGGLVIYSHQWPLLLTWINFNPSMDK